MFAVVYAAEGSSVEALLSVARDFSPRIEACGAREVVLDLSGLTRLFGDAKAMGGELRRTAADRGLRVRIAIADTRTAARLLVHERAGITIIEAGHEAAAVDALPLALLARIVHENDPNHSNDPNVPNDPNGPNAQLTTLRRWGLRTLGDLAALPSDEVAARLGQAGVALQRLARGEDPLPLVPSVPEERFEQALDLEWPIEGLEPLSFVLARLLEPLSTHLERRDRGAAALHVRLHLVTREVHERSLQLPAPMRDPRTLRTLALLDLESHPPSAAIDRVVVAVDPTPGRVIQFSLLTRPLPTPEQLSTLMARLTALMGEGRCGSAVTVDAWEPGPFEMTPFTPRDSYAVPGHGQTLRDTARRAATKTPRCVSQRRCDTSATNPENRIEESVRTAAILGVSSTEAKNSRCASVSLWPDTANRTARSPRLAIRRFRFPIPARVRVDGGVPVRVISDRRGISGGTVDTYAGPWRTSGGWWVEVGGAEESGLASSKRRSGEESGLARRSAQREGGWDRDEWDVTLSDGATYRIFRDRDTDAWFVEGVVD